MRGRLASISLFLRCDQGVSAPTCFGSCEEASSRFWHEVLVQHEASNIDLSRATLQCLKPGEWLNDEVLNLATFSTFYSLTSFIKMLDRMIIKQSEDGLHKESLGILYLNVMRYLSPFIRTSIGAWQSSIFAQRETSVSRFAERPGPKCFTDSCKVH
ncbi:hypothetical protein GOP47_0029231 [Adiantum capillus-veneris]|nr:hypothetical protein GOP47_0029231 [Adiantum capillus-veneris]